MNTETLSKAKYIRAALVLLENREVGGSWTSDGDFWWRVTCSTRNSLSPPPFPAHPFRFSVYIMHLVDDGSVPCWWWMEGAEEIQMDRRGVRVTSSASVIFHNDICQPRFYYCHLYNTRAYNTPSINHVHILCGKPHSAHFFSAHSSSIVTCCWKTASFSFSRLGEVDEINDREDSSGTNTTELPGGVVNATIIISSPKWVIIR